MVGLTHSGRWVDYHPLSADLERHLNLPLDAAQAHRSDEKKAGERPLRRPLDSLVDLVVCYELQGVDTQLDRAHYDVDDVLWLQEELLAVELSFLAELTRTAEARRSRHDCRHFVVRRGVSRELLVR